MGFRRFFVRRQLELVDEQILFVFFHQNGIKAIYIILFRPLLFFLGIPQPEEKDAEGCEALLV